MVNRFKTLYGAEAAEQQKRYEELSAYFAEEFGDANALHISVRRAEPRWAATTPTTTTARCWRQL